LIVGLTGFGILLIIAVVAALVVWEIGKQIAPVGEDTPGKLAPYACGEDVPAIRVRMNLENFFIYAVYFMIFDVLGFVMVTTLARPANVLLPVVYAGTSLVSILMLALRWKN